MSPPAGSGRTRQCISSRRPSRTARRGSRRPGRCRGARRCSPASPGLRVWQISAPAASAGGPCTCRRTAASRRSPRRGRARHIPRSSTAARWRRRARECSGRARRPAAWTFDLAERRGGWPDERRRASSASPAVSGRGALRGSTRRRRGGVLLGLEFARGPATPPRRRRAQLRALRRCCCGAAGASSSLSFVRSIVSAIVPGSFVVGWLLRALRRVWRDSNRWIFRKAVCRVVLGQRALAAGLTQTAVGTSGDLKLAKTSVCRHASPPNALARKIAARDVIRTRVRAQFSRRARETLPRLRCELSSGEPPQRPPPTKGFHSPARRRSKTWTRPGEPSSSSPSC